jgi:hypothetical protein
VSQQTVSNYLNAWKSELVTKVSNSPRKTKGGGREAPDDIGFVPIPSPGLTPLEVVYRLLREAQTTNNMLRDDPTSAAAIWKAVTPKQEEYVRKELQGTIRVVTQILEAK